MSRMPCADGGISPLSQPMAFGLALLNHSIAHRGKQEATNSIQAASPFPLVLLKISVWSMHQPSWFH